MDHAYKNLHQIMNKKKHQNQNPSTVENSENSESQKLPFISSSLLSSGEK